MYRNLSHLTELPHESLLPSGRILQGKKLFKEVRRIIEINKHQFQRNVKLNFLGELSQRCDAIISEATQSTICPTQKKSSIALLFVGPLH